MHTLISSHPERNNDSSNATTVRRTQRQFAEVKPTTSRSPGAPERSNDYIPIARCSRTQHHLPRWRQQHLDRQALSDATTIRRSDDNYISIARRSRTQRQRHLDRPVLSNEASICQVNAANILARGRRYIARLVPGRRRDFSISGSAASPIHDLHLNVLLSTRNTHGPS